MTLAIVVALADEAVCLQLSPPSSEPTVEQGPAQRVRATISGVGAERARAAAEALLAEGATALLSWGTAGGLSPELVAGSLLLPHQVLDPDGLCYPVDTDWRERVHARLADDPPPCDKPLYTSLEAISSTSYKQALQHSTGACAVDMESAVLAQVAEAHAVPFLALRVVVDPAHRVLPSCALAAVDEEGQTRPARLLMALLRRPGELPGLIRLGKEFAHASTTLRRVASRLGPDFLSPP